MKHCLLLAAGLCVLASIWQTGAGGEKGTLKITNLEKVNTDADETDPYVYSETLWYASNKSGNFEILIAKRAGVTWQRGTVLLTDKDTDYRSPFYFPKNDTLYFATNKLPDEKFKDLKNYDIKAQTAKRQPLPLPGISEKQDELHPCIAAGGKEFYFSRKVGKGWKLFVANGPAAAPIGKERDVGFPDDFHHATVAASGLTMYLQGPLDKDRTGIFRSKRAKTDAKWSMPEEVSALNDAEGKRGDMSPALSADGVRLYFASDRPGGKGGLDLYSVLTKELK